MKCKILLVLCTIICLNASLEAATLRGAAENKSAIEHKLDYEGIEANVRSARQAYSEDDSGEDSDEDDEEDDAELQHQAVITRQQAYEQSVDDSHEGSDEDNEENFEEDDDEYFGRRLRREVSEAISNNEIEQSSEREPSSPIAPITPSSTVAPNTSVLILIRDAIKKVTELSNSQQVATSAQQYFQLFEHFLQQTIEQVIGDDDDEDESEAEAESTTVIPEGEKETVNEISGNNDSTLVAEATTDKATSVQQEVLQSEQKPEEDANVIKP